MQSYYTRVCNFYYGTNSKNLVNKKLALPLNGNDQISFDKIEIISRKSIKRISIKKVYQAKLRIRLEKTSILLQKKKDLRI